MFRCLENKNSLENDSDEQNGSIISALVVAQWKSTILINYRFESHQMHFLSILNRASFIQAFTELDYILISLEHACLG